MDNLRERRMDSGLSLSDMADALNIAKQTVSQWEVQGSKPSKIREEQIEEILAHPEKYRKYNYSLRVTKGELTALLEKVPELRQYIAGLRDVRR